MSFTYLALGILGVWRITHLLNAEDGPWLVSVRIRRAAGDGFWGELLDCFLCLSVWIAAPFAVVIGKGVLECVLLWPALSGAAILLERLTAQAEKHGMEEDADVVLRTDETGTEVDRPNGP